jgi:hydrogenase expression/formation protein HypC
MCIGIPVKVLRLLADGVTAVVAARDEQQTINLMLLEENVEVGDYLVIQVGGFAVEKMTSQQATNAIDLIRALEEGEFQRANELY